MANLQNVKSGDLLVTKRGCVWVVDPDQDSPQKYLRSVRSECYPEYRYDRWALLDEDTVVTMLKRGADGSYEVHVVEGELPQTVIYEQPMALAEQ